MAGVAIIRAGDMVVMAAYAAVLKRLAERLAVFKGTGAYS